MKKGYLQDIFVVGGVAFAYFSVILISGAGVIKPVGGWKFVQYIFIAPITEEIIFRGFLQKLIKEKFPARIWSLTSANIFVSVIFASLHFASSANFYSLSVFFPSLIFGLLYDRNGSVIPCIVVHSIFNLNIFIVYQSNILIKIFGGG